IEETRRTVADMKAAGVRVVALSNTNREHVEVFMSLYSEFAGMFDALYFSNEMGARKPERRIYETVLDLEGVEGREAVFFDDKLENVEAALELGIEGVHFIHDSVAADWWEGKRGVE
ncbi:MAG: HAD-IA family hydrolase, partial [Verrucomicrobiota bacterium]